MSNLEKSLVGLPFYEKESQEGLDITLKNIDDRLNELDVDTSVIVQVNGPETAQGRGIDFAIDQSRYNAEIEVVKSEKLGQTRALNDLMAEAAFRGIQRAFMTDADIYRFPDSMKAMWEQADKPVIGARYRPYPVEVVEEVFGPLSYEERLLYQVFDGDQTPQAREVLQNNGIDRRDWVKASLMLLDVDAVQGMHGDQYHVTDSVMNRIIGLDGSRIADGAYFMHMGRVDMGDHIKARLRHFRGAVARNDLDSFLHKEILLPDEETMNRIAEEIRTIKENGDFYAMLYLTRCAVREKVNSICFDIVSNEWDVAKLGETDPMSMHDVVTYADAQRAISRFFLDVDWNDVCGFAVGPPPTTQERLRSPFDLEPYMADRRLAKYVFDTLGISSSTN